VKSVFRLKLKGKVCIFVDWANVYGWRNSLKRGVDAKKLYKYLRSYKEVKDVNFYFGTDANSKSKIFLTAVKRVGFKVCTKPVKYILVTTIEGQKVYRRKCDFDMEMCIDAHHALNENFDSFVFFTGDGDFEPLYKLLLTRNKHVVVIFADGHLGKEIAEMTKVFKKAINKLDVDVFI